MDLCDVILFLLVSLPPAFSQCTFPTSMVSTSSWLTSTRGTWTVESGTIHNFTINIQQSGAIDAYSFDCYNQTSEGYYIIKSQNTVQPLGGMTDFNVYICMKIDVTSGTNLQYYLLEEEFLLTSTPSDIYERWRLVLSSDTPTVYTQVCSETALYTNQERLHVAIASNNVAGAKISFPCDFQATYSYHSSVAACSDSSVDVCFSSLVFNYTHCNETQMYSMNGTLSCIFYSSSTSSGTTTYQMYLYNDDTITPDETTYFTFTCMLFSVTTNTVGTSISLTVSPTACLNSTYQTTSSITGSTGSALTFTNLGTSTCADPLCATTTTSTTTSTTTAATTVAAASLVWLYVVIVILIILLVIIILVIIFCCIRKRRKSKIDDEEAPITEDKDEEEGFEQKEEEEKKKEDEDDNRPKSAVSSKYKEQEEDQRSVDSGFRGDKEDVSPCPVPDGEKQIEEKEEDKNDNGDEDEDEEENETTQFVAEEPETENETLNKEEEEEEEPVIKENELEDDHEEKEITEEENETTEEENLKEKEDVENEKEVKDNDKEEKNPNEEEQQQVEDEQKAEEESVEKEQKNEEKEDENSEEKQVETEEGKAEAKAEDEKQEEKEEHVKEDNDDNIQQEEDEEKAESQVETTQDEEVVKRDDENMPEESEKNESVIVPKEANEKVDNTETENESAESPQPIEQKEEIAAAVQIKRDDTSPTPATRADSQLRESSKETMFHDKFYEGTVDEHGNPVRIGKKKRRGQFVPKGQLTNVLITREMEEKQRNRSRMKKREKLKLFAKEKKGVEKQERDSSADSQDEGNKKHGGGIRAAFMAQYEHKKNIEKELDEQHYWSDEKEQFNFDDEFDFSRLSPVVKDGDKLDEKLKDKDTSEDVAGSKEKSSDQKQSGVQDQTKTFDKTVTTGAHVKDSNEKDDEEMGIQQSDKHKSEIGDIQNQRHREKGELKIKVQDDSEDDQKRENAKDSGMETGGESPDIKTGMKGVMDEGSSDEDYEDLEEIYSDSDEDMFDLPPGLIRDSSGRIIRESDGQVVSDAVTEREYKKARLGRLFKIPRLKRSKQGRPTGGYIEDKYGPKVDIMNYNGEKDGPKLKHRRQSSDISIVSDLMVDKSGGKNVMFDIQGNEYDLPGMIGKSGDNVKDRQSVSSACRRLLKKRLFKQKRRKGQHDGQFIPVNGADDNPRELNALVKVYGKQPGTDTRYPSDFSSKTPRHVKILDQEQIERNREGLERDKHILGKLSSAPDQRVRPFAPKQAFLGQSDNFIDEISLKDGYDERYPDNTEGIDIGNEDEFVLVGREGGGQEEQQRLFTMVKHPVMVDGMQKSFDMNFLRHQHEKRHAIPWSLLHYGPSREGTRTDLQRSENFGVSKSAGTSREKVDDRRLKELLEELYRDKKYFDHVVETTEAADKSDIDERDLAEHGRDYLLDRAEFWEGQGPLLHPRPPPTALGMRLSRLQTNLESGRLSNASTTSSQIPHIGQQLPGQIETNEMQETNKMDTKDKQTTNTFDSKHTNISNDSISNGNASDNKENVIT